MDQIFIIFNKKGSKGLTKKIYNIPIYFTAFENSGALMVKIGIDENISNKLFEWFPLHEDIFGFILLSKVMLRGNSGLLLFRKQKIFVKTTLEIILC